MPPEQLWSADWGGDMDFEYDHDVYWSALHDMCQKSREQRAGRWAAAGKEVGESEEYLAGGTAVSVTGFKYDEASHGAAGSKPAETGAASDTDVDVVEEKLAATKLDEAVAGSNKDAREAAAAANAA